ncbi:MAG: copper resistance protein CopC [Rhizobiales bacterium]|nr:copper resistance protein CopC [Hyphomicrobiales bacterium]MBO6700315.1 copper resistance protein CopC [Hyphomicrobiales bacterium]MBO6737520.1 copper resistance protein CopC [Hyphomicrobiales bacterium]MBO6913423.1 copper resistance protein CopC [Hyphomicrobiales bacterium]MBO6955354.1 copper resistance protein CopC [Hyphomicrobiales bacterium]
MKHHLLAAALLTSLNGPVLAHSPVNSSDPADGATVQAAPETLTLMLAEPGRFMKVEVTHTTVDGSASRMMELEIPSRDMTDRMEFSGPNMGAGSYHVEWRVLGEDGHAMDGTVTYTVAPE